MPLAKLVSDGTPSGTHVYDSTGHEIKGISEVKWMITHSINGQLILIFENAEVEVQGDLIYDDLRRLK